MVVCTPRPYHVAAPVCHSGGCRGRATKRNLSHPTLQYERRGQLLADGFFGVVWALRSDLDYLAKGFKLQHHARNDPCVFCQANSTTLPMTDFRPTAAWRGTEWSVLAWRRSEWARHELFKLPGVSVLSVAADLMHCKHLGTDMYVYGSVLWKLCYERLPGPFFVAIVTAIAWQLAGFGDATSRNCCVQFASALELPSCNYFLQLGFRLATISCNGSHRPGAPTSRADLDDQCT